MKCRLAITSGDIDGVGAEVVSSALLPYLKPEENTQFFVWLRSRDQLPDREQFLCSDNVGFIKSWADFSTDQKSLSGKNILFIESANEPCQWVEEATERALEGAIDGIVTGPLSKSGIIASGRSDIGHTEILGRMTGADSLFMTFLGQKFHVILLTGHMDLMTAYQSIDAKLIARVLTLASQWIPNILPRKKASLPMGVVGANPHAGEGGLLGTVEREIIQPALVKAQNQGLNVTGPLVPDICFQPQYWDHYSLYIASYHDQGLIPFKMIHSNSGGVHVTLGLPFVRTSVDHGTAKDIFGQGQAKSLSMSQAIRVAQSLVLKQNLRW